MVVWVGCAGSAAEQSIVPPGGGADAKRRFSQRFSAARRARSKDPELASDLRIEERS